MPLITQLFAVLVFACLSFAARGEKLRIVTEPWAPYVYEQGGKNLGLDYETTAIVFKRLGIEVEWQFLPWKRCLSMLETGQADGALDIFHSDERDATLLYPSEPLSDVEFVMFYANDRPHPFHSLEDLKGLTVGTSPGYLYSSDFRESTLFTREPAPTHEANFGKLVRGRDNSAHEEPPFVMYANGRRCAFSVRRKPANAPSEPDRLNLLQRPSDRWRENGIK